MQSEIRSFYDEIKKLPVPIFQDNLNSNIVDMLLKKCNDIRLYSECEKIFRDLYKRNYFNDKILPNDNWMYNFEVFYKRKIEYLSKDKLEKIIKWAGISVVPYWFCRNTWGTRWGNGGYFKMAMYPINTKTAFEKIVTIKDPDKPTRSGGIYIFEPSFIEPGNFKQIQFSGNKTNEDEWYKKDLMDPKEVEEEARKLKSLRMTEKTISSLIILFIVIWIIVMWLISRKFNKRKN